MQKNATAPMLQNSPYTSPPIDYKNHGSVEKTAYRYWYALES